MSAPDVSGQGQKKARARRKKGEGDENSKRRMVVSTACIACRRRKSKCDGNLPACNACSQVYHTPCVFDPGSDHRRKGVYRKDIDRLQTHNSTLQTLIQALLNSPESDVPDLVRQIRTCESLDTVAENILAKEYQQNEEDEGDSPLSQAAEAEHPTFEGQLSGRMGELRVDGGNTRYIGGTSNLLFMNVEDEVVPALSDTEYSTEEHPAVSWTRVVNNVESIRHLMNMYFTWHYTFFTCLSKTLFYRDFLLGRPRGLRRAEHCSSLLVNAMLCLGCHFTSIPASREDRDDSATAGDHFFQECKRILIEDELDKPKLTTVQALALMSVREAGCGREEKGWMYSGMSFRMALDLGLNLDSGTLTSFRGEPNLDEKEEDIRRITFWGCFLFDKCWSNYLGRMPQLPKSLVTVPKFEVFPGEESEIWAAYSDSGFNQSHAQPSRTRAVALQISTLCEISGDIMTSFYNPIDIEKSKNKQSELNRLSDLHQRLEEWRRNLAPEFHPREGGLPSVLVMHMFFQLLYIHLFRPFLKYSQSTSPLPPNISPRKICTQGATMISKLFRLYRRSHGLRQICNVAVYIIHSACTIHLLNLPDPNSVRDITHGVKHLEEMAEGWLCARRTLGILSVLARKWKIVLPDEAQAVLVRTESKFGAYKEVPTPEATHLHLTKLEHPSPPPLPTGQPLNSTLTSHPSMDLASLYPMATLPPQIIANPRSLSTHACRPSGQQHPLPPQSTLDLSFPPRISPVSPSTTGPSAEPEAIPSTSRTHINSPSDMFGGVNALLRETDWWFQDQAQLARGFGNWADDMGNGEGSRGGSPRGWWGDGGMRRGSESGGGGGNERGGVTGPNGVGQTNGMNGGQLNGENGNESGAGVDGEARLGNIDWSALGLGSMGGPGDMYNETNWYSG
ncbi:hypothetical protein P152DRAFT_387063 [Eremomyces bilateralis CBS 781.70]|uniref:Zn(2)-C6 fungal-type domain-containing protein n=1 Tax=Eremomyces bilateralis CBS 781.70 TaxID=1392243 RepID=A0A6G1GG99_9PEZI|nr:uncharacterized protein P152DRAFT_387063 [Eremomyces bilateralis CBS 781.70]KAF1817127.1 hypothetical protein P152DRAFT_387063 [Eremomyces bilateralis CBS 781.70]